MKQHKISANATIARYLTHPLVVGVDLNTRTVILLTYVNNEVVRERTVTVHDGVVQPELKDFPDGVKDADLIHMAVNAGQAVESSPIIKLNDCMTIICSVAQEMYQAQVITDRMLDDLNNAANEGLFACTAIARELAVRKL